MTTAIPEGFSFCLGCNENVRPTEELEGGEKLLHCPACDAVLARVPRSAAKVAAAKLAAVPVTQLPPMLHGVPEPAQPRYFPVAFKHPAASLEDQIRERLAVVESQITNVAELKRERTKLRAMLKAAGRPR